MQIEGRRIRRRLCSPESSSISEGKTSKFQHASLAPCPPQPQQSSSTAELRYEFQQACPPPPQQPHPPSPSPPPPQPHSPSQIGARNERDRRKIRLRSPESSSTSGIDEATQQPHSPSPPPPPPLSPPPPQHPPSPSSPVTTPRSIRIKSSITTGGLDEHGFRILRTLFKQKDDRIFFNIRFVCTCGTAVKHSMMTGTDPSFTFRSMAECHCGKDYHVVFEGNSYDVSCCRRGEYEEIAYYSGTVRE